MIQPSLRSAGMAILAALFTGNLSVAAAAPDWENPQLTGLNNEAPHATMVICPDAKTALSIAREVAVLPLAQR